MGDKVLREMEKLGTPVTGLDHTKVSLGLFLEYAKSFRTDVNHRWIENYFNQIIRPRLSALLGDCYGNSGRYYMVDEVAYETGSLFLGKFVSGFEKIMRVYKV